LEEPGAASSSSAAEPERQCKRRMTRLVNDLKKLIGSAWKADDVEEELERLKDAPHVIKLINLLRNGPNKSALMDLSIKPLYTSRCGALRTSSGAYRDRYQNFNEVWVIACQALEEKVVAFLAHRTDIKEETYPQLWELLSAAEDAALNSLPEMALSPEKLMQMLKDTKGENGAPFGRLPPSTLASHPNVFVRRLVCLELPDAFYADLPDRHVDLIDKVVQHRRSRASDSAEQPALITASDIKKILCDFSVDPWSNATKKRWLFDVLKVPARSRNDDEYWPQIFETMVDDFMLALLDHSVTGLALSPPALATLALYRHILVAAKEKRKRPLLQGPVFRLLANASGTARKQYLPVDACGEYVELTANCMPAYWRRMQNSAEPPVDDLCLPVASPPVMCWICGEGFLHNGALFKHCGQAHGDYAEYRKRLFWRAQKDGFKPLLPWVKRHMLESATFHLTYSIPGSFSLK
jgi:hypothetical protein